MNAQMVADVFWISLAAFLGFEIALGLNYVALKYLLRAMKAGLRDR